MAEQPPTTSSTSPNPEADCTESCECSAPPVVVTAAPQPSTSHKGELERRSSKSKLAKQSEVEEEEEDHSPSSETSDATIVPSTGVETPVFHTPGESPPDSSSPEDNNRLPSQRSTESDKSSPTQTNNPKVKLVRSQAVVETDDASPPPDQPGSTLTGPSSPQPPTATLSVSPTMPGEIVVEDEGEAMPKGRYKLGKSSSQSSLSENGTSPALSRDSSVETQYTDSTGVDLENFIKMTLNKNRNDRIMLFKLENDMINYIKESENPYLKFPAMTSYHRMLVHRVAAFFGLDHNVDQSGKCVIVNRTTNTRIPDFKFRDHVKEDASQDHHDHSKRPIILRRDKESSSFEEGQSPDRGLDGKKSKSFEEREEHYKEARRRIFNENESGSSSQEGFIDSPVSRASTRPSSRGSSKEDVRGLLAGSKMDPHRPWSSTESSGYSTDNSAKHKVTKASSFHGQTSREDSKWRGLSKTDSQSSGTSSMSSPQTRPVPSVEGPDSTSSSQSAPSPAQAPPTLSSSSQGSLDSAGSVPFLPFQNEQGQNLVVWVATAPEQIPVGSLIIDPHTCQPFTHADGSPMRWQQQSHQGPPPTSQPSSLHHPPPISQPSHLHTQTGPAGAQGPPSHPHQGAPPLTLPVPGQLSQAPPVMGHQPLNYSTAPPPPPQQHQEQARTYSMESSNSEVSQQLSSLTLTPQSSVDSQHGPPSEPPPPPVSQAPPHQHLYMQQVLPPHSGASPAAPGMGPPTMGPQPQQQQPPHTFMHQQVQYYNQPQAPTAGPPVRYMYPISQGQNMGEVQGQPLQPHQQQQQQHQSQNEGVQFSCAPQTYVQSYPNTGYPVMGFPQMTVQSVETYQQQQQQQQQQQTPQAPPPGAHHSQGYQQSYSAGSISEGPQTQTVVYTSTMQQPQVAAAVYQQVSTSVPMYYSSQASMAQASQPPMMGYPSPAPMSYSMQGGPQPSSSSPPSQVLCPSHSAPSSLVAQPHQQQQAGTGQQLQMAAQYYTNQPPSQPTQIPIPRQPSPMMQFAQGFPMAIRGATPIGISLSTRTTPPPQAQLPLGMNPTGVKVIGHMDPRLPTTPESVKEPGLGAMGTQMGKGITMVTSVRPTGPGPLRAPSPGDPRLVGPSLQLYHGGPRPRGPVPTGGSMPMQGQRVPKGRKNWKNSGGSGGSGHGQGGRGDNTSSSPHSSTESTGSSSAESYGGHVLEVFNLPSQLLTSQVRSYLNDLITSTGAELQFPGGVSAAGSSSGGNHQGANLVSNSTVLLCFGSEAAAQNALASYGKSTNFKLRYASTRQYECMEGNLPHNQTS